MVLQKYLILFKTICVIVLNSHCLEKHKREQTQKECECSVIEFIPFLLIFSRVIVLELQNECNCRLTRPRASGSNPANIVKLTRDFSIMTQTEYTSIRYLIHSKNLNSLGDKEMALSSPGNIISYCQKLFQIRNCSETFVQVLF